jgi:HD-GYP domain-containing protein (c-di-GMP phosphodiesterase class II)
VEVRLNEILGSLSLATDLGAGVPSESALRTAIVAVEVGRAMGLANDALSDVYYSALLRYLGCTGYAHEQALFGAGDDLGFLAAFEAVDPGRPAEVLTTAFTRIGRGASARRRAASVMRLLSQPGMYGQLATAHCAQAVSLAEMLGFNETVTRSLGEIYEQYDGKGQPNGLAGEAISLPARISHVACTLEIHARVAGPPAAAYVLARRSGRLLDPEIVDACIQVIPELIERVGAPSVWDDFLAEEPAPQARVVEERVPDIALAFARYIDNKSPYTGGHSVGVARVIETAAVVAELPEDERQHLHLAALLHDLGRASVPNGIWDKRGAWNDAERERVEMHSYHSERILGRASALATEAELAGLHHERLDGSGYYRGVGGAHISPAARLLAAADAYHESIEERASRPALSSTQAAEALRAEARAGHLDAESVECVLVAAGHAAGRVRQSWPAGLSEREVEVLRELARGYTNKQIGSRLYISARTVQVHVRHIYEKTGVNSRASAALFAVTHDLYDALGGAVLE